MKKIFFVILSAFLCCIFCIHYTQTRPVFCEDLEYRLHLTRTDIEMLARTRHVSTYKDAFLRELQDQEIYLQQEIDRLKCFR